MKTGEELPEAAYVRRLIGRIQEGTGLSLNGLARKGKIAASSLSRFMNRHTEEIPSGRNLAKVIIGTGFDPMLPRIDRNKLRIALICAQRALSGRTVDESGLAHTLAAIYNWMLREEVSGRDVSDPDVVLDRIGSMIDDLYP